ncbi:MAG TPA: helix-turn-helix transcriptional regulator [Candidatus Limnocylindrales bacterium]|jgi:transcriptional regulator with XRE-family HTH domain|nr:helix-turn-helix transcriptional regulator [Candidatus Limnocylindrales bacterium]
MDAHRLGRLHRLLRQRAGMTQTELAARAGVARWIVVRLEAGGAEELRIGDVARCFAALGGRLDVRAWYGGAAADRLLDEVHALVVGALQGVLVRHAWQVHPEVTYSEFGERGSIDLLGWHPPTRALMISEVKSEIGSVEGTLRPFDAKCRLTVKVARERFGWQPAIIGRMLVLPDERTVRRSVERHAAVLYGALPARSRALRSWVSQPAGNIAGIWFLTIGQPANVTRNPSAVRRVRRRGPRSGSTP